MIDNVLPDEVPYAFVFDGRLNFGLYPFDEVVNRHKNKSFLRWSSWPIGHRSVTFNPSLREWSGAGYLDQVKRRLLWDDREPLALITF